MLQKSLSFVGPQTNNALEYYHVNKAFISCQGIHIERGISDSNEMQALVKKKMIEISDEIYLLADYSKFGVQAFSRVDSIQAINYIITGSKKKQEQIQDFKELSIKVIRS